MDPVSQWPSVQRTKRFWDKQGALVEWGIIRSELWLGLLEASKLSSRFRITR